MRKGGVGDVRERLESLNGRHVLIGADQPMHVDCQNGTLKTFKAVMRSKGL